MNLLLSGLTAQNASDIVMGFSAVTSILFLVVILFFGYYGTHALIRLHREKELFPNRLMYPNYCLYDECIDPEDYIKYIYPRLGLLSAVMLLSGVILLVSFFIPSMRSIGLSLALYGVPFVVYLYYSFSLRRAAKKYW